MKKSTPVKTTQTRKNAAFKMKSNIKAGAKGNHTQDGRDPDEPVYTLVVNEE